MTIEKSDKIRGRRIVAIVPMRHNSERVPGKNYRLLGDRPLFHHIVETLLSVDAIDEVVIDTDSDLVRASAADSFPRVSTVVRPEHLRSGDTPMNDVLLNTIENVEADIYLQTHSTNPFLSAGSIERGLQEMLDPAKDYDSIFSVSTLHARLWSEQLVPMNHDPRVLQRTQDLAPIYLENSCIYIFTKGSLVATNNRIGERPGIVEVNGVEAIDIDNEEDFVLAERIASGGAM